MCGILLTTDERIGEEKFRSALALMNHRGPDATGYHRQRGVQLGHNRLKIIDLDDRSNQPFFSHDGRYTIIFNGEIYNFKELWQIHGRGPLRTTSDTEIVLELYALYGKSILPWLNGMFALAIYDAQTEQTFIARDRLGVKPLYLCRDGVRLTIASEVAPILLLTERAKVDPVGVRQYLKLRTCFNQRTIYSHISFFPAGACMSDGKLEMYWTPPAAAQTPPSDEELRHLITTSVNERLVADVPVGSYLSGGLDSSIVAALAKKPDTWTVGFAGENEFEWARMAAKHIESKHNEVMINEREFIELAKAMVQKRREPLSVPNEVLLYKMTNEVKKLNTVVLSGEGADELFFGYDRIYRWAAGASEWNLAEFSRLYAYGNQDDLEIVEDAVQPFLHYGNPLTIVARFFQVAHLQGLLRRLDNSTMLCSVEARVPFVDCPALLARMIGVPFDYCMKDGVVKSPLKRVFRDLLPQSIIDRQKVGFPVPLEHIPFGGAEHLKPFDKWLQFNLAVLFGESALIEDLTR